MSQPIAPSTLDPPARGVLPDGSEVMPLSLEGSSSNELFVWRATAPRAQVVSTETERRFKFDSMPQAVGAARRVLRAWEGHFNPDLFYDLSLCVSELVTNMVRHGDPRGGNEIELVVRRSDELIRAEVLNPEQDVVVVQPLVEAPSDWGIFIVDRVADRWGVDRGKGTVVWCEIDLASDGRSRSAPPLGMTLSSLPS